MWDAVALIAPVEGYRRSAPRLAEWLEESVPDGLSVLNLPPVHQVSCIGIADLIAVPELVAMAVGICTSEVGSVAVPRVAIWRQGFFGQASSAFRLGSSLHVR